jgi:hypothetical protein
MTARRTNSSLEKYREEILGWYDGGLNFLEITEKLTTEFKVTIHKTSVGRFVNEYYPKPKKAGAQVPPEPGPARPVLPRQNPAPGPSQGPGPDPDQTAKEDASLGISSAPIPLVKMEPMEPRPFSFTPRKSS